MLHRWILGARLLCALLLSAGMAILVGACGSSSSTGAQNLLQQTFHGAHRINSGVLNFTVKVTPRGSKALTTPVILSFGGPFQSRGSGKLPASDFTVSITAQRHTGSLAIVSTGTEGFVTLSGASYRLPAADFQQLESSFSSITSSGSSGSGSRSTLSRLGINPLGWLSDPADVGSATVDGAETEHVRARVNVSRLLGDLNTLLSRAKSLGVSGASSLPTSISPTTRQNIASEVRDPTLDVWTGTADKTLRKLQVGLGLPVTGQASTLLGGMSSAGVDVDLQYSRLNQPQVIVPPTNLQPYSQFQSKLAALVQDVEQAVASGALGTGASSAGSASSTGGTGTGSAGSAGSSSGAAGATSSYSQCISAAGTDLAKAQKCAALLNGGG